MALKGDYFKNMRFRRGVGKLCRSYGDAKQSLIARGLFCISPFSGPFDHSYSKKSLESVFGKVMHQIYFAFPAEKQQFNVHFAFSGAPLCLRGRHGIVSSKK